MNYYEILGVSADATEQQIKEAYRREAMKWHPDRHDGAAAKGEADRRFKDLALAYRTLRNPAARADYDRELEQKLRREYDARQQEQARQQKAQNEQAQKRQAKQGQPRPDFAETGTQFEEETVSGADANRMFFEQMLDLAFELAGRGFAEAHISKALKALGCPESMAQAVAKIAGKQGRRGGSDQTAVQRDAPAIKNFDDASWEELEPYYGAAIVGSNPRNLLSRERYDAVQAVRKGRGDFWLGLGFVVLVIGLLVGIVGSTKAIEVFGVVIVIEMILLLLAILAKNLFLGSDQKKFFQEKTKHYYLNAFKALHMEKHGSPAPTSFNWAAALFNISWLGYRRQLWSAFLFLLIYGAIGVALTTMNSGAYATWNSPASLVVSCVIGFYGNRLYFNKIQSRIRSAIDGATHKQALTALYKRGGPNLFGWILPMLFIFVFAIPIYALEKERESEKLRIAQVAKAEQVAAEQAAEQAGNEMRKRLAEEQTRVRSKAEYDGALKAIEARYPQLNPDSQYYNADAMSWVGERKTMYDQGGGRSPAAALQQAVTDYAAALQQRVSQSNIQSQQPAPPQDSATYFGGVGERVNLNFQNIAITSLMQVIADFSGRKFYVDDQIRGSVSIRVSETPWTEALLQMLKSNNLAVIKLRTGFYIFPSAWTDEVAKQRAAQKGL